MTWDDAISSKQTDSDHEAFLNKFPFRYDKVSEKFVVTEKSKTPKNSWIKINCKIFKNNLQNLNFFLF